MAITVKEYKVPSSDGIHTLWGQVYLPEGEPVGYLHVVHGMTEHIRRYDPFMRHFAERGFLVFGYDHLGHGYTAAGEEELGYIADKDGWQRLADDVGVYAASVKAAYPLEGKPYYLMGHSMGSFYARQYLCEWGSELDGAILMGTGYQPKALVTLARTVCRMLEEKAVSYRFALNATFDLLMNATVTAGDEWKKPLEVPQGYGPEHFRRTLEMLGRATGQTAQPCREFCARYYHAQEQTSCIFLTTEPEAEARACLNPMPGVRLLVLTPECVQQRGEEGPV